VEVVALPADLLQSASANAGPARDSLARLRTLDDSAEALETRFRALRDTLSGEVRALETADRRTRSYAVRYAEIRRRTLAAETLRSNRDSIRARADALRARLSARSAAPVADGDARVTSADGRRAERRPMQGRALTLSLAPGRWWIGAATFGAQPMRYESVTVRRGVTDTVHLGARGRRRLPGEP
jgi:hypothetical protein